MFWVPVSDIIVGIRAWSRIRFVMRDKIDPAEIIRSKIDTFLVCVLQSDLVTLVYGKSNNGFDPVPDKYFYLLNIYMYYLYYILFMYVYSMSPLLFEL